MTKEEIIKKKAESLQAIQQGMGMLEQIKGQISAHRGKVLVYDELLESMGVDPDAPPAEFPPKEDETDEEQSSSEEGGKEESQA